MGATILSRTVGGMEDKRVVLSAAQIARPLSFGSAWNKLRLGVRWSMTNNGANLTGTPRLALGVCSGVANVLGDATTTNFVGVMTNQPQWTFAAGAPSMYRYTSGGLFYAAKKVGSNLTLGSAVGGYTQFPCDQSQGPRFMQMLEITKGSPNLTLSGFVCQSTGDITQEVFLGLMEAAVPSLTGYNQSVGVAFAADEAAGALDTFNLYWDRTNPVFEISDIAVARLA